MNCEVCGARPFLTTNGSPNISQHHWSYLPEHKTDTIPLCSSCHRKVHCGSIPEPRTGRVYDGKHVRLDREKRHVLTVALSPADLDALRRHAAEDFMSLKDHVRRILIFDNRRRAVATTTLPPIAKKETPS